MKKIIEGIKLMALWPFILVACALTPCLPREED